MNPFDFFRKWRGNTNTERQSYQQFFLDLCALVGHATPRDLEPDGKTFAFQAGAAKLGGGQGYADVWFKDHFAIEFKGPNGNLDRAYQQIQQYRDSLGNPPRLVTSDTQQIIVHTNFNNAANRAITYAQADLDAAVFTAYGWPAELTDEEILDRRYAVASE